MTESTIVYQARLHRILFFWPTLFLFIALFIGIFFDRFLFPSSMVVLLALIWGGMVWLTYHFSALTIKKKQVILTTGILVRQTIDIPMNKIESIDIRQSVLGSILQYGSLVITGTGGTRQYINYLDKPLTCRRYIEQSMHE